MNKIFKTFSTSPKNSNFFWTEVNSKLVKAQYAVRGLVPQTANKMNDEIAQDPSRYPFKQITYCNIGNPQQFHQKPITFNRQVLSCLMNPEIMSFKQMNIDAARRADGYLQKMISVGSYSLSFGLPHVRTTISNYLAKNDEIPKPHIQNIYTTEGASQGVHLVLSSLITNQNDTVMIPIPQYPLYSAAISLYGGSQSSYYLNEEKGWQLDTEQLQKSIKKAQSEGKNVKAIVVINPGNPTGSIYSRETIEKIIEFAVKNRLVIMADEVYRQNVYKEGVKFNSLRKVLEKMPDEYRLNCELVSINSISKGLLGECGLRGGYMYLHNINPDVKQQIFKLKTIYLCSNTIGQSMVDLMCNPPLENVQESTKNLYIQETQTLFNSLRHRAELVTDYLNQMQNVHSCQVEGAMYAFPSIKFSKKAIEAAGNQKVDQFYCMEVLKNTGIALVPGSGFLQKEGTYHFRITTLILPEEKLKNKLMDLKRFNSEFHKKYE